MKQIFPIAALALLAACGGNDAPAEDVDTVEVETPEFTLNDEMAAMVGSYEMTGPDGGIQVLSLNDNGTYSMQDGVEIVAQGDWTSQGNQLCLSPAGGSQTCYTGGEVDADGSFRMEAPGDDVGFTVRKVDAEG